MLDIMRPDRRHMGDHVESQGFSVEFRRGIQVNALDGAMRHRLRDITSARKIPFGELFLPRIGDMFRQARLMAILVRLDLPVIAAGLDEKHRIGTAARLAPADLLEAGMY